ncbi:MAG TPA: hypothetical protein PKW35_25835, partial [Nannocystaceae bacterium]|nr:hypothetical protein [Nannocystaceae bacterium]
MNPRLVALRSELLAALGFAALTSSCTIIVDGSTGTSGGSTGPGTSTTGTAATGTGTSAGTSAGTDSATGTTSGATTSSTTANESTGDASTSAGTTTTATSGDTTGTTTTGTTGTTGDTGILPECDPVPAPPPDHLQDYACFPLPDGLGACEECVGDCLTPKVDGAITGDPLFCSAQGLVVQCGPDPNAAPGQCCYYAAYLGIVCEGRPLSVDGELRTAPPVARADWLLPHGAPHDEL